jgi:hypothetical protein
VVSRGQSRGESTSVPPSATDHANQLRRLRHEVEILRGSEPWAVLVLPAEAPREKIEQAATRLEDRYTRLAENSDGETQELALQLLARVRDAASQLLAQKVVEPPREMPGDDAFRAGLRAMSDGDWASADKRFAHARD